MYNINNSPCILIMKGKIPIKAVLAGFAHIQQPGRELYCKLGGLKWWPVFHQQHIDQGQVKREDDTSRSPDLRSHADGGSCMK